MPTTIGDATLYCGDCVEVLKTLPECSVEACLTDPPYGLSQHSEADIRACLAAWLAGKPYTHGQKGFMGKSWDSFVPGPEMWRELYRVLKPGAHLLVFAGTRTADLMSLALRLAGFENRDCVMWTFGAGFPKSLCVSKAIDALKGAEREVVGTAWRSNAPGTVTNKVNWIRDAEYSLTTPATPEATQWEGWKSSLKPCYEPILLFRKPLDGTIAETVLKWGCGGLNVGVCRVESGADYQETARENAHQFGGVSSFYSDKQKPGFTPAPGRYPGNLIVSNDESVQRCFPVTVSKWGKSKQGKSDSGFIGFAHNAIQDEKFIGDSGSASRFFQHCDYSLEEIAELNGIEARRVVYSGKASKRDRDEGCEGMEERDKYGEKGQWNSHDCFSGKSGDEAWKAKNPNLPKHNHHPTCKPTSLLRYCLKLICPPGATVIDPFFGSGSTGKAALLEGFKVIGIEREPEYFDIAVARCAHVSPEAFTVQPTPRKETAAAQGSLL